jgi:hypothetical protein
VYITDIPPAKQLGVDVRLTAFIQQSISVAARVRAILVKPASALISF